MAAWACQEEAQFAGTIASATRLGESCILKVESFNHYSPSVMCPLWESDVLAQGIETTFGPETCAQMNGATISGYLVRATDSDSIILE